MTSWNAHLGNMLSAAERGRVPDEDDLAQLPRAIAVEMRTATNRLVALAAAGAQVPARDERRRALELITTTLLAEGYDPSAAAPHSPADRQAVRDAIQGPPSEMRTMIEGISR